MIIREYRNTDNLEWVRCRVLSFLDSAYFDNVLREKEHYKNPALELVAEIDGKIVGLIDVEYEIEKLCICNCFAHYVGENIEDIKKTFKRVHECNFYELIF